MGDMAIAKLKVDCRQKKWDSSASTSHKKQGRFE